MGARPAFVCGQLLSHASIHPPYTNNNKRAPPPQKKKAVETDYENRPEGYDRLGTYASGWNVEVGAS